MTNPGYFFSNNIASGILFLEALRTAGIKRFIFSSSAAVYGAPLETPIRETHPKNPMNSYGETKLMFERVLEWYARAYGWTVVSFRYFNASGATAEIGEDHRPETHIIPLLLQTACGDRPYFEIHGTDYPTPDGTCLRDYVHVKDIAVAHRLALVAGPGSTAYNIGTGTSHSVREMRKLVEMVTGRSVAVREGPRRPGDPAVLCADPGKLQKDLGWQPEFSDLQQIVESAWLWKQSHAAGYASRPVELSGSR